ncbi:MAG: SRPBCC domain-containing protein [Actinomycetota bacterium]
MNERTVTRERTIPAEPGDVWDAITEDDGLGASIDAVPGGLVESAESDRPGRVGAVEFVSAPSRLRYRWWPVDNPDQVSTVDVTLEPVELGTTITVVEELVLAPITIAPQSSARGPMALALTR